MGADGKHAVLSLRLKLAPFFDEAGSAFEYRSTQVRGAVRLGRHGSQCRTKRAGLGWKAFYRLGTPLQARPVGWSSKQAAPDFLPATVPAAPRAIGAAKLLLDQLLRRQRHWATALLTLRHRWPRKTILIGPSPK